MKKLFKGLATIALSAVMITGFNATKSLAATTIPDNYGAYIVATGEVSGGDGYTAFYTKVGDGNATMIFDLLLENKSGYFGFICGDADTAKDLTTLDYVLTGSEVKTTFEIENEGLVFDAGYTYKATYESGKENTLTVERKEIGADDGQYDLMFKTPISTAKSNLIGIATISEELRSSTVIIDNFQIIDPYGDYYVNNTFNAGEKVSDDGMKNFSINTSTGDRNSLGGVSIYNDMLVTVRFVDEEGNLIATQKVCVYGSATSANAPSKDGLDFYYWSESLDNLRADMIVYPIYGEHIEIPEESVDTPVESVESPVESEKESVIESNGGDTSTSTPSSQGGGCGGSIFGGAFGLTLLAVGAIALKRRNK